MDARAAGVDLHDAPEDSSPEGLAGLLGSLQEQAPGLLGSLFGGSSRGFGGNSLAKLALGGVAAFDAYASMDYVTAVTSAARPTTGVLDAAEAINIPVEQQSWEADYKAKSVSGKFVDGVDYPRRQAVATRAAIPDAGDELHA